MSEGQHKFSNIRTVLFTASVCIVAALLLSIVASSLKAPQEKALKLYKSKQLLLAAGILTYRDTFQLPEGSGYVPANFNGSYLTPTTQSDVKAASSSDILAIFNKRVKAMLVNSSGELKTFTEVGIDQESYIEDNQKYGYAQLTWKLIYIISDNQNDEIYAYVIPINGYGLWDAIYGYLALKPNGNTVLGTTWYDQKETPGLGGNISLPSWQKNFKGKVIFKKNPDGQTNFARAPLGITVVKTTVAEEFGSSYAGQSAVDGIAGATVTENGVTAAYKDVLNQYRAFLIKANEGKI